MLVPVSFAAILCATAWQGPPAGAVAPFVGPEVAAVAHVDLAGVDVSSLPGQFLGGGAADAEVRRAAAAVAGWVDALKKAGAKDLFILIDPAVMPGLPVVVVPAPEGADAPAIAEILTAGRPGLPLRWPAAETIRGAVVAGSAEALARFRQGPAAERPGLAAALSAGEDAPVRVALVPSDALRRAVEESTANLPQDFGGGPITDVTRGMRWACVGLKTGASPGFRAVVQAAGAEAARTLAKIGATFLDEAKELAGPAALAGLEPRVEGDRVTVSADAAKIAAALEAPVRQAREAAARTQCANNLKQIGLAMHNYHAAHNTFPPRFSAGKDGKPLLSWRVHVLPFLAQKALYDEFHLDEPWDSPHNKALISRMPVTYACPSTNKALAARGETTYVVPAGAATIFPGATGVKIQDVTDGTSNTVLAVDAGEAAAVVWTKPDDWEVGDAPKAAALFGQHGEGGNVLFGDGSVRFLKKSIKLEVLKHLLTRNGGEAVANDDL